VRLEPADQARHGQRVGRAQALRLVGERRSRHPGALVQNHANHSLEPECAAVLGPEDARDPVRLQLRSLLGGDRAPPAAIDADVSGAPLLELRNQVAEELHVAALVGGDGHGVGVLLHGSGGDLLHRAVVAQVDHLGALAVQDAAHDVDGRIVAVEERSRRHHSDRPPAIGNRRRRGCRAHLPPFLLFALRALPARGAP